MISLHFLFPVISLALAGKLKTCAGRIPEMERTNTLEYHNDLRSTIALGNYIEGKNLSMPTASNMLKLEWSCELEKSAQKFADRCEFKHLEDDGNFGENLFMVTTDKKIEKTDDIILAASDVWQQEFIKFGWKGLTLTHELFMTGIGHATQMSWANTRYIGCSYALCKEGTSIHVVCQYEPRGNIINHNIYDYGKVCSDCPQYSVCDRNTGLCEYKP